MTVLAPGAIESGIKAAGGQYILDIKHRLFYPVRVRSKIRKINEDDKAWPVLVFWQGRT
ncbi:hypothetical protein [Chitinophaga sp.]|uniref:hypothetical protein n=1 Tax=Chitinophaga sp. TaxID=1869181 RepID=UPI002F95C9A0